MKNELWDIADREPVITPNEGDGDMLAYKQGIKNMPSYLKERYFRCIQTMEVIRALISNQKRDQ